MFNNKPKQINFKNIRSPAL